MDIENVRALFGDKYDGAIKQTLDYNRKGAKNRIKSFGHPLNESADGFQVDAVDLNFYALPAKNNPLAPAQGLFAFQLGYYD
jgi:hypothetical protein